MAIVALLAGYLIALLIGVFARASATIVWSLLSLSCQTASADFDTCSFNRTEIRLPSPFIIQAYHYTFTAMPMLLLELLMAMLHSMIGVVLCIAFLIRQIVWMAQVVGNMEWWDVAVDAGLTRLSGSGPSGGFIQHARSVRNEDPARGVTLATSPQNLAVSGCVRAGLPSAQF